VNSEYLARREKADSWIQLATGIVESATKRGLVLRVMGAVAFAIHARDHTSRPLERTITDIDFMGYSRQQTGIDRLLEDSGLEALRSPSMSLLQRSVYTTPDRNVRVDVFHDKLEMCHVIDFRRRLEIDCPTISLADLLLEKLQIVEINEKDLLDCANLLRQHELGDSDKECINTGYVGQLLSDDWGFNHTVEINLHKVESFSEASRGLTVDDKRDINAKIAKLRQRVEREPKSLKWRMRSRIGESRIWYKSVEFRE
jgi:hypothetical protein